MLNLNKIKKQIVNYLKLITTDDDNENISCLVMLSGGKDSMSLLHVINQLNLFSEINVLYINHGDDGSFNSHQIHDIVNLLQINNLNFIAIDQEVISPSETNWRRFRYDRAAEIVKANPNIKAVFTGHHKEDQLENYLISIMKNRTHEMEIPEVRDFVSALIIRPFIDYDVLDIIEYVKENNIVYFEDETNREFNNIRNVIRNCFYPAIRNLKDSEQYFNSLGKFAKRHKELERANYEWVKSYLDKNTLNIQLGDSSTIEVYDFLKLSEFKKAEVIEAIIFSLLGSHASDAAISALTEATKKDSFINGEITFELSSKHKVYYSGKLDILYIEEYSK